MDDRLINSETYKLVHPSEGVLYNFDKKTNNIIPIEKGKLSDKQKLNYERIKDVIIEGNKILSNSPFKSYKPLYLDPNSPNREYESLLVEKWSKLYLKDPDPLDLKPWKDYEKAYYESLDGRSRYNYLVSKSGITASIIYLPETALIDPPRPTQSDYILAYDDGMKYLKEADHYAYKDPIKAYEKFLNAENNLKYAYYKGKDYKAGLELAQLYFNEDYIQSLILNSKAETIESPIYKKSMESVRIFLDLIKIYDLPEAYYGLYLYDHLIFDKEFGVNYNMFAFNDPRGPQRIPDLYNQTLKAGSYDLIKSMTGTLKSALFSAEWKICAGILGDKDSFYEAALDLMATGFKARSAAAMRLSAQLGCVKALNYLSLSIGAGYRYNTDKQYKLKEMLKNPPLDDYRMMPYLDEIIPVDWIIDFSKYNSEVTPKCYGDTGGNLLSRIRINVESGNYFDPRDSRCIKSDRVKFKQMVSKIPLNVYQDNNDRDSVETLKENDFKLIKDIEILEARIIAAEPPQGYVSAPLYRYPEDIIELYENGKLDRNLYPKISFCERKQFNTYYDKIHDFMIEFNNIQKSLKTI